MLRRRPGRILRGGLLCISSTSSNGNAVVAVAGAGDSAVAVAAAGLDDGIVDS